MSGQAIDLYRVQRQLVWEILYWEKMGGEGDKPTMLDALRVLQHEQPSLFWYVADFGKMSESKLMDIVEEFPAKTFMTEVHADVFTQHMELNEANPEVF